MTNLGLAPENIFPYLVRAMVLFTMVPVHEYAHGLAADLLGDDTPRKEGRLTLNPFAHLDWTGSVLMFLVGIGWGKPVSVDVRNFKSPRRDMAITAFAGPLSNLLTSLLIMVIYKLISAAYPDRTVFSSSTMIINILMTVSFINISLAVFNLIPVPPLDGSKILGVFLPQKFYWVMLRYQRQITIVFMLLLFLRVLSFPIQYFSVIIIDFFDKITFPIEWLMRIWIQR